MMFWGTIFVKNADFLQKNADITKIKRVWYYIYVSYLFTKFQVSSIIQRVSDMGIALSPPLPPQQNETLKKC